MCIKIDITIVDECLKEIEGELLGSSEPVFSAKILSNDMNNYMGQIRFSEDQGQNEGFTPLSSLGAVNRIKCL